MPGYQGEGKKQNKMAAFPVRLKNGGDLDVHMNGRAVQVLVSTR